MVAIYHVTRNTSEVALLIYQYHHRVAEWQPKKGLTWFSDYSIRYFLRLQHDPIALFHFTWLSILRIVINLHYYATFGPLFSLAL